jgi:hypothetical protein
MNTNRILNLREIGLLIIVSAITITLTACGLGTASGKGGGNAANTTASGKQTSEPPAAPVAGGDAQTTVSNAMHLRQSQPAYQVRTTSTSSMGGQPTIATREYVAPDRMHMVSDGSETIVIGKAMYVKKGGAWQNMGTQMSDMTEKMKKGVEDMTPEERAAATKGLTASYKSLGDEMLDGTATATYEMDGKMETQAGGDGNITITTVTKYWISKSNGLILKEETNGEEMKIKIKSTSIYAYDPNVKIEAPMS